jgi:hypothetical protein
MISSNDMNAPLFAKPSCGSRARKGESWRRRGMIVPYRLASMEQRREEVWQIGRIVASWRKRRNCVPVTSRRGKAVAAVARMAIIA